MIVSPSTGALGCMVGNSLALPSGEEPLPSAGASGASTVTGRAAFWELVFRISGRGSAWEAPAGCPIGALAEGSAGGCGAEMRESSSAWIASGLGKPPEAAAAVTFADGGRLRLPLLLYLRAESWLWLWLRVADPPLSKPTDCRS